MIFAVLILVFLWCVMIVPVPSGSSVGSATGGALLLGNKIIDGDMPTSAATVIYTSPSTLQSSTIMVVSLVNTTVGAITVNLYVNVNGTDRSIISKGLSLAAAPADGSRFAELIGISIPPGATIKADASGSGVDYVIQLLEVPSR